MACHEDTMTFEELSQMNLRKEELKEESSEYIEKHPEIKTLLSSFMCALLLEKPDDVYSFAKTYFSSLKPYSEEVEYPPLVIAGPSGVGKGTLINRLIQCIPEGFGFSVSHTTRSPRPGEVDGVSYNFTTVEKMRAEIEEGKFIEHAEVHGCIYGTSLENINKIHEQGRVCVLDIDIQGVQQVKNSSLKPHYLFIAPPSMEVLEQRLRGRGTESEEKILLRVKNAQKELDYSKDANFDRILINDNLETCFDELKDQLRLWYPHLAEKL